VRSSPLRRPSRTGLTVTAPYPCRETHDAGDDAATGSCGGCGPPASPHSSRPHSSLAVAVRALLDDVGRRAGPKPLRRAEREGPRDVCRAGDTDAVAHAAQLAHGRRMLGRTTSRGPQRTDRGAVRQCCLQTTQQPIGTSRRPAGGRGDVNQCDGGPGRPPRSRHHLRSSRQVVPDAWVVPTVASGLGESCCGAVAGGRGALKEVDQEFQVGFGIVGEEVVHRAIHA